MTTESHACAPQPSLPEFRDGLAVVVGGSGGIGGAIAVELSRHGSRVALTYNHGHEAAQAVAARIALAGGEVSTGRLDVTNVEACTALLDRLGGEHGPLHSVVYAAGPSFKPMKVRRIPAEEWSRVVNTDTVGCFHLLSAALPHLRRSKGSFLAVTTAATQRAPEHDVLSAAPKAAIETLVRVVAMEEGPRGVRANCVGPGWIDTALTQSVLSDLSDEQLTERVLRSIPLRHIGNPSDVAHAALFLLSRNASYITGETINVAGGMQL